MFTFKNSVYLFAIPLIIVGIFLLRRLQRDPSLRFPSIGLVERLGNSWRIRFAIVTFILRLLTIVFFMFALAGPRKILEETLAHSEGVDIVLAIDISGSMAAEDFEWQGRRQNRLMVVKKVVADFIDRRSSDRLGIIAFAARAYTVSPMTTDYNWLKVNLARLELGLIEDGTAIGSAVMSGLSRLQKSPAKSRLIILMTDGINNAGTIDPRAAAHAAKMSGVKMYTIGAGSRGVVPFPVKDAWGRTFYQQAKVDIDEELLREMATTTGGQYYRATDTESLKQIYKEIDRMEKVEIEQLHYRQYQELFPSWVWIGLLLLALELILRETVFLKLP